MEVPIRELQPAPKTPNEELAERVVHELLNKGFITASKQKEILAKLNEGTASQDDWRVWIEVALNENEEEDENGEN